MKKFLAVVLIVGLLTGCSREKEEEQVPKTSEKPASMVSESAGRPAKKVEGLHDKQLEEAGVTRDKDGNYGPGSIDKIINR